MYNKITINLYQTGYLTITRAISQLQLAFVKLSPIISLKKYSYNNIGFHMKSDVKNYNLRLEKYPIF